MEEKTNEEINSLVTKVETRLKKEKEFALLISKVVRKVKKEEKYFDILHPDYNTLSEEERYVVSTDQEFISENLEEIDNYYETHHGSGENTEQEIIANAIRDIKQRQNAILEDVEENTENQANNNENQVQNVVTQCQEKEEVPEGRNFAIVVYKEKKWYKRVLNKILSIFK